ncbi:DUF4442 domain-containing protein [Kangiella koreensis]|uniref:Translation elongation factor P (EF-P) n=1 Tax=Kangiella koreensis (strain DSM 16069 / JCM 12317 / KCTC 12182 / SW-125) TaxID=523791 RepID=C7R7S0_KANKD|nr:DUF4442 domain-containing protein [Kangiella koreensis]ACV27603.1 translation elongation factor P (EF-P) [Kangiella koreensis DSM 16069]
MRPRLLKFLLNLFPPYLGAGIRIKHISNDFRTFEVEMKLRWYNRNMMGSHFGGNLSSMTDPFFVLILMYNLGRGYIIWDQASSTTFKKPATGKVTARFHLSEQQIQEVKSKADSDSSYRPTFTVDILDEQGTMVTQVEKIIYVKKREPKIVLHNLNSANG